MADEVTFDPQVEEGLMGILSRMGTEAPEIMALLDSAKRGEITQEEAMSSMLRVVQEHPELSVRIMELAAEAFTGTRQASMPVPHVPVGLKDIGDEAFFSGVGLPQMNPLMEAALAERLQFDGDIPELRHGPLPPGATPALAVKTTARNPVAIGEMLQRASARVSKALKEADKRKNEALERVAESKALAKVEDGGLALAKMAWGSAETDLAEYRRGEVPAPVAVRRPSGRKMGALTKEEQQEHAWRFLSTTQGRRSAMEALREIIFNHLTGAGVEVRLREYNPNERKAPLAFHEWKVNLSGRQSMQPAFNIIDTAGKAIAIALERRAKHESTLPDPLFLEVIPVNTVDIRAVGWAARLVA